MDIQIDIESEDLETRNKRDGQGTYQVQEAFVHTCDRNGNPNRYPERINVFPPRDGAGRTVPYKKGKYTLAPQSLQVDRGFLQLNFVNLTPIVSKAA